MQHLASQSTLLSATVRPALVFARGRGRPVGERSLGKALQAAMDVSRAAHPRNCLRRVAYLLCELACTSDVVRDSRDPIPLSRDRLAEALGISLSKVKRVLALLSLSQVIGCDGRGIRVLDWRRLGATANFDLTRMAEDDDPEELVVPPHDSVPRHLLTTSGEPAYFG